MILVVTTLHKRENKTYWTDMLTSSWINKLSSESLEDIAYEFKEPRELKTMEFLGSYFSFNKFVVGTRRLNE